MSDKRICHAEGDKCLGCDHYRGKADKCVYADTPKPDTVTISRECAERSHVRASYYLQAAYNKAVGPEALKDFNELTKALEVKGE